MEFSIKNNLLSFLMKKRINNINQFIKNPIKTQQSVLKYLINQGEKTEFGKQHKFQKIITYNDFCQLVPIRTYEETSPYIEQVRNGSTNVLWPGKIKWFAKSSGTTNSKSKFIPISKESLHDCHFKGGKDMLSLYENHFPKTNIYNGKGLMLGGAIKSSENGFAKEGDLSAILLSEFPFWVNMHRVPDIEEIFYENLKNTKNIIKTPLILSVLLSSSFGSCSK